MLEATLVAVVVSSVVFEESEIAMEGGGVRLTSSCLLVELEEVLAEGNVGKGAGSDRGGCPISSTVSRDMIRCLRARMRSSV